MINHLKMRQTNRKFLIYDAIAAIVIIALIYFLGIPIYNNLTRQAPSDNPIEAAASIAVSTVALVAIGLTPAQVVALVDGKIEEPPETTPNALNRGISGALTSMAWSLTPGTPWRYTVHAALISNPGGAAPPLSVCVTADAGSVRDHIWTATTGHIYYSSVLSNQPEWTGNVFTGNFVSGMTLTKGGACNADGSAATVPPA